MGGGGGEADPMAEFVMNGSRWLNGTTGPMVKEELPLWAFILDRAIQLPATIVGFFANIGTMVTLIVNGDDFSDIIRMLFMYQSLIDALICLSAALLFGLPPMWTIGNEIFDEFICQFWHGQYVYWTLVCISVHNLVTLALDRYICVCHSLKYQAMSKKTFRNIIIVLLLFNMFWVSPGCIQTAYRDGVCHSELLFPGQAMANFFKFWSMLAWVLTYAIPTLLFLILYGLVIFSFRKRAKENLGASRTANVITKATSELTKTAIIVTVIFIVALGFDLNYFFLSHLGVLQYVYNSPLQKVAVFFSVINSVANPFVYASCMPLYRKSIKLTFFKPCISA